MARVLCVYREVEILKGGVDTESKPFNSPAPFEF